MDNNHNTTACGLSFLCIMLTFRNKKLSTGPNKEDGFAVSANMAYDEVNLECTLGEELYEVPDWEAQSDEGHYELTEHPATTDSPPAAPVYDTVDGQRAE